MFTIKKLVSCFACIATIGIAAADTSETYSENLPGTTDDAVLFENAHLLAVTGISLDIRNYFGNTLKTLSLSNIVADDAGVDGIYHYSNNGSTLEAHFEWKNSGYNFGLLLILTQDGNDIRGRVAKVCYPGGAYGTDLKNQGSGSCQYFMSEADQDAYKSSSTFSTSCKNLVLTFAATESHTVTFVDWDGTTLKTQSVDFGADATPPANPSRANYVFVGWDTNYTGVTEDLTVTALYHAFYTVTFLDANGTTLDTQQVEETTAATAPDMTGRVYGGNPFSGWDADFSSISSDLTVTAVYAVTPADVAAAIDGGQLPAGALVWGGGVSGTWNDSTANWYNLSKVTCPWSTGAVAVFPSAAAVTVSGPKQVGGFIFPASGAVALSGDAFTLDDGSSVTLNGKFAVLSNNVSSAGAVSFACNDVDESLRSWKGVLTFDDTLLFPGASLADVSNLTLRMKGKFGGAKVTKNLTTDIGSDGSGIHFYSADETQISGQAKVKTYNSYGGVWEVIKFVLTQEADGIHGHVEYACGGTGDGGWTADRDMDPVTNRPNSGSNALVTAPEDDTAAWNAAPTYARAIYAISYNDANTTYVAPEVRLGGTVTCSSLTVDENLTVRLVGGGQLGANGTYSGDLTVNGTLVFAGDNAQTIKGGRSGSGRYLVAEGGSAVFDCSSGGSWTDLAIAGTATVNGYWTLPGDNGATRVLPGGIVDLQTFYTQYGPQGSAPLYIHTNGLVRLTKEYSIGRGKPFHAVGGVIAEAMGGAKNQLAHHVYLSNGADFIGTKVGVGDSASNWSILSASGETPSFFSVTNLVVGLLGTVNANNKALGVKIDVEDVTGDERTDLTFRSVLQERPDNTARYNEGFRENCGLWKTGEGTVEFTAANSCATSGVFKVEAGTVRLGAGCGGKFGPLIVLGDAAIDCAGGTIAFEDSADMVWTEGSTLSITGNMGKRTIRVGTDNNSLTAGQLAAIKYVNAAGKAKSVSLTEDGYLVPPSRGTSCVIR